MAQGTIYSGREFSVYVNTDHVDDPGVGIQNVLVGSLWKRLDVDSVAFPGFDPVTEFEMRSGAGRMADFDQVYVSNKRVITEFTLSGRLTTQDLVIFGENAIGIASTSDKIVMATGFAPTNPDVATEVTAGDYHLGLSFYFAGPGGASDDNSYKLCGCICSSLTLSADMDDAAGRFNFSATFKTAFAVTKGAIATGDMSGIGATKLFLADLGFKHITMAGTTTLSANDSLWKSISCTIENPVQFLGTTGVSGNPEVMARGVPETTVVISGSVKYDGDTDQIVESFRAGVANDAVAIYLSNVDIDSSSFHATSTGIGFNMLKGKFQSAEVSSDDVAMVNFECKALDPGTGNAFELLVV